MRQNERSSVDQPGFTALRRRPPPRTVKSADRTAAVLELLATSAVPLSLTQLQHRLQWPKSSLYLLLQTLAMRGWLQVDPHTGGYGVGMRALMAGNAFLDQDALSNAADPVLVRLRQRLGASVQFSRLVGRDMVVLASRDSGDAACALVRVGGRLPVQDSVAGLAVLARRSLQEVAQIVADGSNVAGPARAPAWTALCEVLARTVRHGHARRVRPDGAIGLAVALQCRHPVREALSCLLYPADLGQGTETTAVEALHRAAAEIQASMQRWAA